MTSQNNDDDDDVDNALCPNLKIEVTCFIPTNQQRGSHSRKRRSLIEGRVQKTTGCPRKYAFGKYNSHSVLIKTINYASCTG